MAKFSSLPIEVVAEILKQVGLKNFRTDVSRLLVCRTWYEIIQAMLIRTLVLYPKNLTAIDRALDDRLLFELRRKTRDVRISLFHSNDSYHHAQSMFLPSDDNFEFPDGARYVDDPRAASKSVDMLEETRQTVARFTSLLLTFENVEAFRLRITDRSSTTTDGERPYQALVVSLQGLSNNMPRWLTTLELSLDNNAFAPVVSPNAMGRSGPHYCQLVATFLPKVKNLAFHLESTCEKAFQLPEDDGMVGLEKLLVNLNPRADSWRHEMGHWTGCRRTRLAPMHHYSLEKTKIVKASKELAKRMRNPKMVRLLFGIGQHTRQLASVDCISGDEMILAEDANMTDDGQVVDNAANARSVYAQFWDR